jgi:hypothetical protein
MPVPSDYDKEQEEIKWLFDNVSSTIINISRALCQFEAYCFMEFSDEEVLQLKNDILTFHVITFQFFIVVNFCKLFETKVSNLQGSASLYQLNNQLSKKYPEEFGKYRDNKNSLKRISKSDIFILFDELRNKSYAHSDKHPLNKPRKFIQLNKKQTAEFRAIFLLSIEIYKNCIDLYGISTTFHHFYDSSSPKVFLKQYLKTKKYWAENHVPGKNND